MIIMPDRSWPGSTKTANGTVVQQGAAGKYTTVGQRRKRGGKHVRDKHKRRMGRKMEVKVGTLNVGTMTGKGRELADMMVKRKVDILCVQETGDLPPSLPPSLPPFLPPTLPPSLPPSLPSLFGWCLQLVQTEVPVCNYDILAITAPSLIPSELLRDVLWERCHRRHWR